MRYQRPPLRRAERRIESQLSRLLGRIPGRLSDPGPFGDLVDPGPLRAHRFGHGSNPDGSATDAEADVLAEIRERARDVHEVLAHDHGVYCVELAGSTGGGKTTVLERLIERSDEERIGVIVGDVAGEDDAKRLRALGVEVRNVNTGKECHLDPNLVSDALEGFDLDALDTLYIENVGNMVCPADFPLGANRRVLVVSTTEGDDVVRKHPMLVQTADLVVINKVDIADAVGTDVGRVREDVEATAPGTPVVETDARSGEGITALAGKLEADSGSHGQTPDSSHDESHDHRHEQTQ